MEEANDSSAEKKSPPPLTVPEIETQSLGHGDVSTIAADISEPLFPESPVYEPEDDAIVTSPPADENKIAISSDSADDQNLSNQKRKLNDSPVEKHAKILKLAVSDDEFPVTSQSLDDEVSVITGAYKRKIDEVELPSTSRVRTPVKSSPKKI